MPIAPCFDPTTGASGGAAPAPGGGGSGYDIPFGDPIDLTDGWTLYDPDNLIKSISYANGLHTVIWNELLTGSNNYNWASGSNTRAPRWYQPAQIDSTQITSDQVVQNVFFMVTDNAATTGRGDFANSVSHAMCANPTSTVATDIGAVGQHVTVLPTGANTAYFGVLTVNSAATTATGNPSRSMATSQYGGRHVGSACFTNLDANGLRLQNGSRNGNTFIPAGVDLYWMVGLGIRSNTTTIKEDDQSLKFKIYRKSFKMNLAGVL